MIKIGTKVRIISNCNTRGQIGTVKGTYKAGLCGRLDYVGVQLDSGIKRGYNKLSVAIVEEREKVKMEEFKNIAIVNLLDDYNKKDYGFALYDEDFKGFASNGNQMVVVNPRGKNNRVLGIVKEVVPAENYGKTVSAQVVGVVNMDRYNARVEEEKRKEEIRKQKVKIEKELKERLIKLQTAEFYEKMANDYADKDPELVKLVEQLKALGE